MNVTTLGGTQQEVELTTIAEYPSLYHEHKARHPHPPMVEAMSDSLNGKCPNCGGKRMLVAFFPEHDKTYEMATGSGCLSKYWPFVEQIMAGMVSLSIQKLSE